MDQARVFAADLLAGRLTHAVQPGTRAPRRAGNDPRGADELLGDVKDSIEELERLRAQDPAEALEVLRGLLSNPSLTEADLGSFIDVWRTATTDAGAFRGRIDQPPTRGMGDWWDKLRAYLHRPEEPSAEQRQTLREMSAKYRFPSSPHAHPINPNERTYETLDPSWVPLLKAKLGEKKWPKGLAEMPRHAPPNGYVYEATSGDGAPFAADANVTVAFLADFGTGSYHSWGIAEQLAAWAFPYVFHLGDVYYAGRPGEFTDRFERPFADVVETSRLLGLAENHELYDGGRPYLEYFEKLQSRGRTPQEGSYFSVRFPHHQVIGLDVNWQGRCRFQDGALQTWLGERLAEANGRTNILLTGNAPFIHGEEKRRKLLDDLFPWIGNGQIGLWFWGDDHYCALFDRKDPDVPFYGSCIGHGGYPGPRQSEKRKTYQTEPLWLEDQPRFPAHTKLRDDVTNNGWCQATLRADGGVDLLYVDWLWCKRASVSLTRDGQGLRAGAITEYENDVNPQRHEPG